MKLAISAEPGELEEKAPELVKALLRRLIPSATTHEAQLHAAYHALHDEPEIQLDPTLMALGAEARQIYQEELEALASDFT